jgi:hypothetical protein
MCLPHVSNNDLTNDSTGVRSAGDAIRCATKRKPICSQDSTLSPRFTMLSVGVEMPTAVSKQAVLPRVTAAFSLVHAIVWQSPMINGPADLLGLFCVRKRTLLHHRQRRCARRQ